MVVIGDRIRQIRKIYKLSQTEFGEKLGVSRSVIINIELNKVKPKELFVNHLCDVFNINKAWLLTGNGKLELLDIKASKNLKELISLYTTLSPIYQEYLLKQIKNLIKLQEKKRNIKK